MTKSHFLGKHAGANCLVEASVATEDESKICDETSDSASPATHYSNQTTRTYVKDETGRKLNASRSDESTSVNLAGGEEKSSLSVDIPASVATHKEGECER